MHFVSVVLTGLGQDAQAAEQLHVLVGLGLAVVSNLSP